MFDIYTDKRISIIYPKEICIEKPYCVFGVLKSVEGIKIKEEMLEWLKPNYNVYIVEQDNPGKYFEYPALRFFFDLILKEKLEFCLYLHTKGAKNINNFAKCVRLFWKNEFINHIEWYKKTLLSEEPIVSLPATGKFNTTWLNGFFVNYSGAMKTDLKIELHNRYYYETIYRHNKDIKVIGRLRNDVDDNTKITSDIGKKKYIDYIKKFMKTKNKKVIYTCITGGYDTLKTYSYYDNENFDYICFTDNMDMVKDEHWEIRPIPDELLSLSKVKQQRNVKICPHKYLKEYDLSIWLDGNYNVLCDIKPYLESIIKTDTNVYIPKHPSRNCIYKEGSVCIKSKKDTKENIEPQLNRYKEEGFPSDYGLPQSNIIIRKHNEEDCIKLMETWVEELNKGSHRDQLSFNYAMWKNPDTKVIYIDKNIYRSKWFKWGIKHTKVNTKTDKIVETTPVKRNDEKAKIRINTGRKVITKVKQRLPLKIIHRFRR